MKLATFVSTRGKATPCSASEAILKGLASDGGLFVPVAWPMLDIDPEWAKLELARLAPKALAPFFEGDPLAPHLSEICAQAVDFPIPLRALNADTYLLELFHGPTNAFKDFGARFLALALEQIPPERGRDRMVLVATSGDTGGAVAAAFHDCTSIPVTILYPKGKISARQEKQLTVWGDRVRAFAVEGTFDDCQRLVKEAFLSEWWNKRFQLISANSINIGRLLPQMAYFAYAGLKARDLAGSDAGFIVPSGNAGNGVAALWARQLGFPIRKLIFAHNANRSVPDYFHSGQWSPRATISTLANAMDVGHPSNFERVINLCPQIEFLRARAAAVTVSDEQIRATIRHGQGKWGEIWCPHTATAVWAREREGGGPWVIVATAHPSKFESIVEPLIGEVVEVPSNLQALLERASLSKTIRPDLESLRACLA